MKLENYKIVLVRLSNNTEKINCMLIWQFSQQNCNLTLNNDMLSIKSCCRIHMKNISTFDFYEFTKKKVN